MLYVSLEIKDDESENKRIYAKEFIPKDKVIWELDNDCDLIVSYDKLLGLTEIFGKVFFERFIKLSYFDKEYNRYILHTNGLQYINHSETPNLGAPSFNNIIDNTKLIALCDIEENTELTKFIDFPEKLNIINKKLV